MEKVIKVPDSWADVSIGQFQEIYSISEDNKNKALEIVSILINEDVEEIRKYDVASLQTVFNTVQFVSTIPNENKQKNIIEVNGVEYGLVPFSELTGGEWIDLEQYLEEPIQNLHRIAGLFYRPIVEKLNHGLFILEPYDTKTSDARAELFKDNIAVEDVYGITVFFCNIVNNCMQNIQVYFLKEIMLMKKSKTKMKARKNPGWLMRLRLKSGLGIYTFIAWLKGISRRLNQS